jgi:hypothetical protein
MSEDNWKVLTVTKGGAVSLLKGLSEYEAREIAKRLDPFYGYDLSKGGFSRLCQDNDVEKIEVFQ